MLLPLLQTQKTAGRRALITQLNEVLEDKFVNARLGIAKKRLKSVRDRVRALEALFTRLKRISDPSAETAEVQEVLGEIVKEAHEITVAPIFMVDWMCSCRMSLGRQPEMRLAELMEIARSIC